MHDTLRTQNTRRDRSPRRVTMLALLLAMVLTAVPTAGTAADAELKATNLEIPAQALIPALNAFAEHSGLQLLYSAELAEGKTTRGVSGRLTPEQALQTLLEGTGVSYRFVDPGTVTLVQSDPLAALVAEARRPIDYAQASEATPDKPQAPAKKGEEGPTVLPEMTVTASPVTETSYNVPNVTTATKTDTPIMETPVSVQVLPQQVLKDQQVIRLEDALKNVSGVQSAFNYGDSVEDFIIRGFQVDVNVYRNGFRLGNLASETAHLDRVEVLKGPAAVLYGRTEPGGLINLVPKRPLADAYYSLQQQFGSYDFYRTTADATGPVTQDGTLLYRFNLAYRNSESFRDFIDLERVFVTPSLTWRPREDTEFNLTVEYLHQDNVPDVGISAIGNRPAPIPQSRNVSEPSNREEQDRVLLDFNWSHHLTDAWTIRNGVVAYLSDLELDYNFPLFLGSDNRTLELLPIVYDEERERYAAYLETIGKCQALGADHTVLLGFDYYSVDREDSAILPATVFNDIFNPLYGQVDLAQLRDTGTRNNFNDRSERWYGLYFQDQIKLWDKLHVLGGGRYDWVKNTVGSSGTSLADIQKREVDAERFSPRVGLVYQPWPWLSLYGNYVESLGAKNGISASGEPFDPQTAQQYEAGLKTDFGDGKLGSTLAFYHITKENLLTPDLSTPTPFDSVTIGEARSQGIELDIAGQVTDSLSLTATYAYTDAKITKDNSGNEGHRLPLAPEHSASLWAKVALTDRFTVGTGVFLASEREGDNENTFQLPGYVRWDAMAAYHFNVGKSRLTAQVNVNNILDKEYFKATNVWDGIPRTGIVPAEPLTVLGSIRLEF